MCHLFCFLTGAGLATYLARRKYRGDRDLDDYDYGLERAHPMPMPMPTPMPNSNPPAEPETAEPVGSNSWEREQRTIRRRNASKAIGHAVDAILEFFQNLGDAITKRSEHRSAKLEKPQVTPPVDQKVSSPPPPPLA